jgi:CubicO group peptidase (beta-lactamase class C family)
MEILMFRRTLLTAALIIAWPLSASTAPASAPDTRLAKAIDEFTQPLVAERQLSGQLLVARHGRIVVERFYGYADLEMKSPVTAETRFNIASITKPMTGTIAIQILNEKKMTLGDSIARWFPDFPKGNRITVGQLMRHRSGIPHELWPDSESTRPVTTVQVVERAKTLPLDHEPDARGGYSSGGFSVLTRILELVSGQSYAELLAKRIFEPLGMAHSSDHDSRALLPGRARAVVPGPNGLENATYQDFSAIVGAGSVWSTARDLHRFVQGVVSGKLGAPSRYAYLRDGKIDFNGIAGGYRSFCDYDSVSGLEVIFLGNLQTGAPDLIRKALPDLAAGKAVTPPALPALSAKAFAEADLRKYEATYELENHTKLVVRVRRGVLWANEWVLMPMEDGGFFSPRDYGKIRFVAAPDGQHYQRLDWEQRGQVYPAPRVAG